nr:zinc-dependent metalloprotease [uncultured Dyadobacter sp.]
MKLHFVYKTLIINLLLFVNNIAVSQQNPPLCGTPDSSAQAYLQKIASKIDLTRARTSNGPMLEYRLGVNIDHKTYLAYAGDITRIRRTVYEIFREASAIFEEEMNIKLTVYHIHIWDKPEHYTSATDWDYLSNVLDYWTAERNEARDAVVGMSSRGGTFYGMQRICTSNFPVPGQEFSVEILCHELGHTLSSPHTHNCWWPGGPIDRCVDLEGASDNCREGFREPTNGTIMSYCRGEMTFHPLCRNVIRSFAEGVAQSDFKLQALDNKPAAPGLLARLPGESGGASAFLPAFDWLPSARASRYRLQIARNADFTGIVEDTLSPQPFFRSSGLDAGNYLIRYQPQNAFASAEWSQALPFRVEESQAGSNPPPFMSIGFDNTSNVTGSFRFLADISSYQVEASESWWTSKELFELSPKGTAFETFSIRPKQSVLLKLAVRYRVLRRNQWSAWSDFIYLRPIPGAVPLRSSATLSTDPILAVRQWTTDPTAGPVTNSFQIAIDPEFRNLVFDEKITHTNAPNNGLRDKSLVFPDLSENTAYYTRSNIRLKTGFQSVWATGQFRTGVEDTRFKYLGIPHPVLHNAQGSGSYIKTIKLLKSKEKLFVASAMGGYHETSDLEIWKSYLPSTTNGRSPLVISAFAVTDDRTTYAIDGLQGTVQKIGDTFSRLPIPPQNGVSGIEDLLVTASGIMFYRNYNAGLLQFTNGVWKSHHEALQSATPVCIGKDNRDRIWTITEGGGTWYFENNQWIEQPRLPFWNGLIGIAFDRDDQAYAYGDWGVRWLNRDKGEWEVIQPLLDKSIQKIVFDDQNRMWLAMYRWPSVPGSDFEQYGILRYANGKVNAYTEGLNFLREPFEIEFFKDQLLILTTGGEIHVFDERQILSFDPDASYPAGSRITVKLSTNSAFDQANRFGIELSNQTTGTKINIDTVTVNGHLMSFTLPDTLSSGEYSFHLIATAPEIISNESRTFRVEADGSPVNERSNDVILLQNVPNPAAGPTSIAFYLPLAAEARVDLFNLRGQFVKQLTNAPFPAGWHIIKTNFTEFQSGMYVYRLTTGNVVKSIKMIN